MTDPTRHVPATPDAIEAENGSADADTTPDAGEGVFWIDEDGEGEPTVWTGDPDRPKAILRRCEIAADEQTRDEVMRRIADSPNVPSSDPAREAVELRAEVEHWKHHAWEAGEGFKLAIGDAVRAGARRRAAEARERALWEAVEALADTFYGQSDQCLARRDALPSSGGSVHQEKRRSAWEEAARAFRSAAEAVDAALVSVPRAVLAQVGAADTQDEGAGERPCDHGGRRHDATCHYGPATGWVTIPTPTAGSKVDAAPEADESVVPILAGLIESVRGREEQRRIDNQPCPHCGGDRLRPNFTGDNGLCHAGGSPYSAAPESGEGR